MDYFPGRGAPTARRVRVGPRFLAVAAALFATALALGGSPASAATGSFTDPTGDANGAPDITSVSLVSDAATSTVELTVTVPGLMAVAGSTEPEIDIFFDTDKNPQTGSTGGNEFNLFFWRSATDDGWDLDKWNGSAWQEAPASPTLLFSRSGDTLTWRFNSKTDITTTGFNFYVVSGIFDASGNPIFADSAPDGGIWTYDLGTVAVVPALGKPLAVPARATHGKLFSVSFPVIRADTGEALTGGTVSAVATVGGRTIPKNVTLANGAANVALQLPAGARGKTLLVNVKITVGGKSATRSASFVIH